MLAIRMQRTGRSGHAMFRLVVQDSHRTPTSGKIVAQLGSYDPHAKTVTLDKEKAALFLKNGAQPSERAARLLKSEGVKLPSWVTLTDTKAGTIRHADKRRSTRPEQPAEAVEEASAEPAAEPEVREAVADEPVEATSEPEAADTPATEEAASEEETAPDEAVDAPEEPEAPEAEAETPAPEEKS